MRPISEGSARQSSTSGQFSSGAGISVSSVYHPPADDGRRHWNRAKLVHVNRHHVATEDRQVGVESFANAASPAFGEFRPGGAGGEGAQRLVAAEPLLRPPR